MSEERKLRTAALVFILVILMMVSLSEANAVEAKTQEYIKKITNEKSEGLYIDGADFGPLVDLVKGIGRSIELSSYKCSCFAAVLTFSVISFGIFLLAGLRKTAIIEKNEPWVALGLVAGFAGVMLLLSWRVSGRYGFEEMKDYVIVMVITAFVLVFLRMRSLYRRGPVCESEPEEGTFSEEYEKYEK